jgi:hypothetical protein
MRDLRGECWVDLSDLERQSLHEDTREIMKANPDSVILVGKSSRK